MNDNTFTLPRVKVNGRPIETILLTINCFKKFCLKASTDKADKIYDYYIKMEDIITKYIDNKNNEILYYNLFLARNISFAIFYDTYNIILFEIICTLIRAKPVNIN